MPSRSSSVAALSRAYLFSILLICCACFTLCGASVPAMAANYVVNSTFNATDGNCDVFNCTLRDAVGAANLNAGDDDITFEAGVFAAAQTINLSSTLTLTENV